MSVKNSKCFCLSALSTDIVFFIFLYQRWIYKVDHKRVNEFGFSKEMEDEATKKVALIPPSQPASDQAPAIKSDRDKKTE